jgi:hypothetical protein
MTALIFGLRMSSPTGFLGLPPDAGAGAGAGAGALAGVVFGQ